MHEINLSLNNVETDLNRWNSYSYSLGHPEDERLDQLIKKTPTIEAKAKLTENFGKRFDWTTPQNNGAIFI